MDDGGGYRRLDVGGWRRLDEGGWRRMRTVEAGEGWRKEVAGWRRWLGAGGCQKVEGVGGWRVEGGWRRLLEVVGGWRREQVGGG